MVFKTFSIALLILLPLLGVAQEQKITNFLIKENLTKNGKLAILAVDSLDQPLEGVNGIFQFTMNGFKQGMTFHDGVAVVQQPLESSNFVFFKHKNQDSSVSKLYYIHKSDEGLKPIKINGMLLLLIPLIFLMVGYVFKRFLVTFIVLAIIYGYFHLSKGLQLSELLETIISTIKSMI